MSESVASVSARRARDLLVSLVETPSPTGEERACAERLVDFFEAHGREATIDAVGNVRAPADDTVLLTSHIDTVPGEIPVRVEADGDEEVLWGRGSVDATGPLAAMAVAAVRTGVSFAGVVGEETDSDGARHLVSTREPPEAVINGEPSGWDGVTFGYRGLLAGTYVATSESGHTSRPENNAIEDAMEWWARVKATVDEGEEWTPVFERVTPKATAIAGGVSDDGLSVEATMDVQLRVPPSLTVDEVREMADGELDTGTVRWHDSVDPVMSSPRTPLASAFRAAIREEDGEPRSLRKTGTSDMNIYRAWDCPMITYGPGDSDFDHAPDERLPLAEFDTSVEVLCTVAERITGET
ncbi:[LysW]-lysine hydrolase [Halococcus thailandensis]|uniref:Putative [LysW]-lysine/[LysW]-ornithine hydrolase n=1 Tax=Halococcus thailandensis JCM 13552 TaxID=1227457 RepID=M0N6P6_9EURY|nr:[LysW]-lysine hydrolase [Halococcus thailandensis]EMA52809.1 acetyl-lysine deacetylase [Halococcus thailandensis JCM 13552]